MLIAGAGGLATQIFEDIVELKLKDIAFWSEIPTKYQFISDHYPLLKTDEEVVRFFNEISKSFLLCIGGKCEVRKQLCERLIQLGGVLTSYISPYSRISPHQTHFAEGTIILNQVNVEPGVTTGKGCLVNKTANIGHGSTLASFCEIGPGVIITGEVELGEDCFIGTGAILHPKIKLGRNVTVAAGAVVTKNVPDNAVVAGVPAIIKYIKKNESEHLHDNV